MVMEKLTTDEAYRAMICFLEDYLSRGDSNVSVLLHAYAAPMRDGKPSDPAAWSDWLKAIDSMRNGRCSEFDVPAR
jgi:hypothetical protein